MGSLEAELPAVATDHSLHPDHSCTRLAQPGQAPLFVRCPAGWTVSAGMGHSPAAVDFNDGWRPCDASAATGTFKEYYQIYLQIYGKSRADLAGLVDWVRNAGDRRPPAPRPTAAPVRNSSKQAVPAPEPA